MGWKCPFLTTSRKEVADFWVNCLQLHISPFWKQKNVLNSVGTSRQRQVVSLQSFEHFNVISVVYKCKLWCKLWKIVVSILLQKQFVLCPFLACERQRNTYCSNISPFHCRILSQTTPNNQSECRKPFSSFDQSLWLNVSQVCIDLIAY